MSLSLFGFHEKPHDIGASKYSVTPDECVFLLDFSRPLERIRWFGVRNRLFGPTLALLVPVVHIGEKSGGFVFGLSRGQPYFEDIPKLWRDHRSASRALAGDAVDGLQIVADFGQHFPEDS